MPVTIQATLLSAAAPQPVQVVADGITSGLEYTITGSTGDFTWTVNAGEGVSTGGQIVLVDLRAPINTPIVYTVTVLGVPVDSDPVTVTVAGDFLLQTLDGLAAIPLTVEDGGFDREYGIRQNVFNIPGRRRPVARYDTTTEGSGAVNLTTDRPGTERLEEVLTGGPVVFRQVGIRDLPPVETIMVTSLKSTSPIDDIRQWALSYMLIDNPEPGVPSVAFSWDDFDTIYAAETWTTFDAEWASETWNDFDAYDWGQRL